MTFILKRPVSLVLILTILVSTVAYAGVSNYDGDNPFWFASDPALDDSTEWQNYKSEQGLGGEVTEKIVDPTDGVGYLLFNRELWEEQGVVVYGDYSLVGGNDWKDTNNGYYESGEFRFHGYDLSGNKHNNNNFPPDQESKTKAEQKNWVYKPWEPDSPGNRLYELYIGNEISAYNFAVLDDVLGYSPEDKATVAKWINEGQDWDIQRSFNNQASGNTDFVNFMSVQTAPTPYKSGQGTMIHIDRTGNDWYQSFSVKRIDAGTKQMTPILGDIPAVATTNYADGGDVVLTVQVTGEIQDQDYYADQILKTAWYTRYDISTWDFQLTDNITGQTLTKQGKKFSSSKGYTEFEVTIPRTSYEPFLNDKSEFEVTFEGVAIANFATGESNRGIDYEVKVVAGTDAPDFPTVEMPEPPFNPILFDVTAPREILDVWNFPVTLTVTDDSYAVDRYVEVNGTKLSESDETKFLNGTYKFPKVGEDRVYDYTITYVHEDASLYFYQAYVIVYDSVPRATVRVDDPGKVNRKVSATADSSITSDFLEANSNVRITSFTVSSPEGKQIYKGADTNALKEFMLKEVGTVNISVTVGNEYGSRNYSHQVYQDTDHAPDIVAIVWNAEMSRLDTLDMMAEGASLDGDTVGSLAYEIKYDSDQDGEGDTVVSSGVWDGTIQYQPDKLGWYDVVLTVTESFGQETIEAHITPDDYKTTTIQREFFVDNLVPMTKVYTDVEYNFPKLDVVFMTDQAITREQNDYIRDNNIDITNDFRINSMVANVDLWDLHTYEFSQTAYKRRHTGSSYPSSTTSYSADGYSGTLSRYDVDNYPYQVDEGSWKTRTLSKTVTMSKDSWGESSSGTTTYSDGSYKVWTRYWATYSYSDSQGYSGSTSGSGESWTKYDKDGKVIDSGATNQPTKSGTAYKTETYWSSNYVTYNDYYGDYSGTVYKYVKQQYTPDYETESNKYIVYIANSTINNLADFNTVHNVAREATVILVGDSSVQGSLGEDIFIENTGNLEVIIDDIIAQAKVANPIVNERAILIGETFTMNSTDIDAEGDPITEIGYQFVHDPDYFDNSLGYETGTFASYNDSQYSLGTKSSFTKPGKYTIYRKIKDEPVGFAWLSKESNLASLEMVVHRRPIASASLDWDYDNSTSTYKTVWVDQSYDPDFQYSDPDKGVVDRSIRYRLTSSPTWIYEIPDNLAPGSYVLEYLVMDKHGVWSNPYTLNFTLSTAPEVQLNASLRAYDDQFSVGSIPASESVEFYNVWTRYPYNVRLEVALYNSAGTSRIGTIKNVAFAEGSTGTKTDNDIDWNNITYQIPSSVSDGIYIMRIIAYNASNSSINTRVDFPITVSTPINLASPFTVLAGSDPNVITATTSIYATTVNVELFRGTSRATTLNMSLKNNDGTTKTWQVTYTAPGASVLPEGNYQARFTATTPSGKLETLNRTFELQHLRVTDMGIRGYWNHWRGQQDIFGKWLSNMPHRFMSYEKVIVEAIIEGNPDYVEAKFSPELEAMTYVNTQGHVYNYVDEIGYTVAFPLRMTSSDNRIFTVEYILPMARSTILDDYETAVDRVRSPYWVEVIAHKGSLSDSMRISDIDITGNIKNKMFIQPE